MSCPRTGALSLGTRRTHPLLVSAFLFACSSSPGEAVQPTAEPITSPPETASPATTAAPSSTTTADAEIDPKAGAGEQQWAVEKGSAKGIDLANDQGEKLRLETLAWTSFKRKSGTLGAAKMPSANVSFATVSANDVVATDVLCTLPPWADIPKDPLTIASAMIPLVVADAVPAAALTKSRPALLACANGKALRIEWEFKDGKLVNAKADGADAKTTACVKGAMAKSFMLESGLCAATLAP